MSTMLAALALCLCIMSTVVNSVQLTFELPDNERQCFYEQIDKGVTSTVEFQVVTGGNYDVDMTMKSPKGQVLYREQRKQYDSFKHIADHEGIHEVKHLNIPSII